MPYTPQSWADGPGGGTPITAARLSAIENGIDAATDTADGALQSASNLADVANAGAARTSLGLAPAMGTPVYAYHHGFRCNGDPASAAANNAAFAAAMTAALALQSYVVLPPGYGYISQPMELFSRVGVEGTGHYATVIQLATNSNCDMIINHVSTNGTSDPNGMYCRVRNLALDGRGASQNGAGPYYGIHFDTNPRGSLASSDISYDATHLVESVTVRNVKGDAFCIEGRSDNRLVECKAVNSGRYGFQLGYDTHAVDCINEKSGSAGFYVTGSSVRIVGCKSYITGQDTSSVSGIAASPSTAHGYVVTGTDVGEVTISGCDAQETSGYGVYLASGVRGCEVSGTVQKSSFGNGTSFASVCLDGSTNNVVNVTSKSSNGVNGLALVNGANRNAVTMGHVPIAGATASELLTSGSATLSNYVIGNGIDLNPDPDWTASTAYLKGEEADYLGIRYRATSAHTSGSTFSPTNWKIVRAPMVATVIRPNSWAMPGGGHSPGTSNALNSGTGRAFAVYFPEDMLIEAVCADVGTAGSAGALFRIALYRDTGSFAPGALLVDAGTFSAAAAGTGSLTVNTAVTAGVYWAMGVVQGAPTTQPTMRTFIPAMPSPISTSAPATNFAVAGWLEGTTVTAAAPATFSASTTTGLVPRIYFKRGAT